MKSFAILAASAAAISVSTQKPEAWEVEAAKIFDCIDGKGNGDGSVSLGEMGGAVAATKSGLAGIDDP